MALGALMPGKRHWQAVALACGLFVLMAGCSDVRPTLKIGVLAPFEGLHRQAGYAALAAVRAAVADFPYTQAGILPLALDDGNRPAQAGRSAQKLLADPRVAAVVGPLSPQLASAVSPVLQPVGIPWYTPERLVGEQWATGLVEAAAGFARLQGARSLVLAGWNTGWPQMDEQEWTRVAGLPVRLSDDPAGIQEDTAVFWMGSPEAGAAYLDRLRQVQPQVLFLLGSAGDDPVFAERAGGLEQIFWTTWTDEGYNDWAVNHTVNSPTAYLVYRATTAALADITGVTLDSPPSWSVQVLRLDAPGTWSPVWP